MVDTALPRDFAARYGTGVDRALVLGGGGVWFVAWQTGFLRRLGELDIHLGNADRFVGTSAGSIVASIVSGKRLAGFARIVDLLTKAPKVLSIVAPAGTLAPSQQRALDLFREALGNDEATIRRIGYAALTAQTPSREATARNLAFILRMRRWPSSRLHITCVDAYTGERCVVTSVHGVPINRAAAASSAVPGIFAPQQILDRRCMDGGVAGTGVHLDVVAGARRALIVSLVDGSEDSLQWGTATPGSIRQEYDDLVASGTEALRITPDVTVPEDVMDPALAAAAVQQGARRAERMANEIRAFWA
jgi:NTE family protein